MSAPSITPESDSVFGPSVFGDRSAMCRKMEIQRDELRRWKESAMKITPPLQEIGRELNLGLGESIHDKILPGIVELKAGKIGLLEALEKIIAMNIQYCIDKHGDPGAAESMACVKTARAAIAKATGKEPS